MNSYTFILKVQISAFKILNFNLNSPLNFQQNGVNRFILSLTDLKIRVLNLDSSWTKKSLLFKNCKLPTLEWLRPK